MRFYYNELAYMLIVFNESRCVRLVMFIYVSVFAHESAHCL